MQGEKRPPWWVYLVGLIFLAAVVFLTDAVMNMLVPRR